jgi:hypothetical protein
MFGPATGPDAADEDLAAEDVNGELIAVFPLSLWSRIRLGRLEHAVLVAAERGGPAEVSAVIGQACCRRPHSPPKEQTEAAAAAALTQSAELTTNICNSQMTAQAGFSADSTRGAGAASAPGTW